jgi:hypothetical protein
MKLRDDADHQSISIKVLLSGKERERIWYNHFTNLPRPPTTTENCC